MGDLISRLRLLRSCAGMPSYREIAERVARRRASRRSAPRPELADRPAVSTVADYFIKTDRARLDHDLFFALVQALGVGGDQLLWWREAWEQVFAPSRDGGVEASSTLPRTDGVFVGRRAELERALLPPIGRTPGGNVTVISGMAGVGKTALAQRLGRTIRHRDHPATTLYVDLGGFHPTGSPADPAAVLARFLRILGVRIPVTLDARVRAYQNALRRRTALVVLDNAADVDQLRPLLPASDSARVITSRLRLELPGALQLQLEALNSAESITVLEQLAGSDRIAAEPEAAHQIVQLCGRLPLALSLVGRHLGATPGWSVADHAARLRELRLDDGVRTALALSYQGLGPDEARLFRRLAVHPGVDIDVFAAAALTGVGYETARQRIENLRTAHLVESVTAPGRYQMHDLVRAYAVERALDDEPASQRSAALGRLLDYYRHTASVAMHSWMPAERMRPEVARPSTGQPQLGTPSEALSWLEAERDNLVAAARYAAEHDDHEYAHDLSAILFRFLGQTGHLDTAVALHRAAAADSDPGSQIRLGIALMRKAEYAEAAEHLERSMALAEIGSDPDRLLRAIGKLGLVYERLGRYPEALATQRRVLELAVDDVDRVRGLTGIGVIEIRMNHLIEAREHTRAALDLCRRIGDPVSEPTILLNLANVQRRLGELSSALEAATEAYTLAERTGQHRTSGQIVSELGEILAADGRLDEAIERQREAVARAEDIGDGALEVLALNRYGRLLTRTGSVADAIDRHRTALELAEEQRDLLAQWHAHRGLADAHRAIGDSGARKIACDHDQLAERCLELLGLSGPPE